MIRLISPTTDYCIDSMISLAIYDFMSTILCCTNVFEKKPKRFFIRLMGVISQKLKTIFKLTENFDTKTKIHFHTSDGVVIIWIIWSCIPRFS